MGTAQLNGTAQREAEDDVGVHVRNSETPICNLNSAF